MKREPSIHITRSDLIKTLAKLGYSDTDKMADRIIYESHSYAIKDRYAVMGGSTAFKKKATRHKETSKRNSITVEKFNSLLNTERMNRAAKLQGIGYIVPITKTDSLWPTLKEVATLACDFANIHYLEDIVKGCVTYIRTALYIIDKGQFTIQRMKGLNTKIYTVHKFIEDWNADDNKDATDNFYEIWQSMTMEYSGTPIIRKLGRMEDRIYMLYGRQEADEHKADYEMWIRAQFEGLSYLGLPYIQSFIGKDALERYESYRMTIATKANQRKKGLKMDMSTNNGKEQAAKDYQKFLDQKNGHATDC